MFRIYLLLLTGILIVSLGSIIIRWTGDVPAGIIAFYRVFISALILGLYKWKRTGRSENSVFRKPHWHYFLAGFLLAVHFISWIASLQMTTIASSIFLVSTHPIFAVIFSIFILREYPQRRTIPAFLIAMLGTYLIVSLDSGPGMASITGDLLALLSAVSFAAYLLIARLHRDQTDFLGYLVVVYGSAAVVCAIFDIFTGNPFTGFSGISWIMMVLLALGPHLSGHSILNWCSRKIPVYKVNLGLLLEPVIATAGGVILFGEYPHPVFFAGAGCILSALILLLWIDQNPDQKIST
jgi:drug/metabolite transporter (DMT)-like permease